MIPAEWYERARAPHGKILVRHRGIDSNRHGLYLPPRYLEHTRTAVGTVLDIHPSCPSDGLDFRVGDKVLLSASGGILLVFGLKQSDESELWVYSHLAVRLVFEDDATSEEAKDLGESHLRNQQALRAKMPVTDMRFVEGDRQGPR